MAKLYRSPSGDALETGGGGRGPYPPEPSWGGGGGGGGRGDGDYFRERLRLYRLGLQLTIGGVMILFITFTTVFVARKMAGGKYNPRSHVFESDWENVALPLQLLLLNTAVLALSSWTAERARRAAKKEAILVPASSIPGVQREKESSLAWARATVALGITFLAGQWMAWHKLYSQGTVVNSGPAATFFFLFTGAHGIHLFGGLLALCYAAFAPGPRRSLDTRRITTDIGATYWHFMGAMWIYVLVVMAILH
jgi:cytochrome c oxidase subunit 3